MALTSLPYVTLKTSYPFRTLSPPLPLPVVLSLLHTFPFVMAGREIRPNTDGLNPSGYGQLHYSWFVSHKVVSVGYAPLSLEHSAADTAS
jgi:hypothetical protein